LNKKAAAVSYCITNFFNKRAKEWVARSTDPKTWNAITQGGSGLSQKRLSGDRLLLMLRNMGNQERIWKIWRGISPTHAKKYA